MRMVYATGDDTGQSLPPSQRKDQLMTLVDVWTWLTTTDLRIVAAWVVGVPVGIASLSYLASFFQEDTTKVQVR